VGQVACPGDISVVPGQRGVPALTDPRSLRRHRRQRGLGRPPGSPDFTASVLIPSAGAISASVNPAKDLVMTSRCFGGRACR
jgi:hypothetical protein